MLGKLNAIANRLVAPGKGLLAADEATAAITRRFEAINIVSTEESRRDYREVLFGATEAMTSCISGVILYDETIRQKSANGQSLVDMIKATGASPGIKLDIGQTPLPFCPGEVVTEGLDGLADRVAKFAGLGAEFGKWRAVISIGNHLPSYTSVNANTQALARYAAICQQGGLVPIVEPDILMDGDHDIDKCAEVTEWVLKEQFHQLHHARVALEGIILKPSMVMPGNRSTAPATPEEVAEKTLRVLKRCVPPSVPGIAFLSGGQSSVDATRHLNLMNSISGLPWRLTYSYSRALHADALKTWGGKPENVTAARQSFSHRARMNSLASTGQWTAAAEKAA